MGNDITTSLTSHGRSMGLYPQARTKTFGILSLLSLCASRYRWFRREGKLSKWLALKWKIGGMFEIVTGVTSMTIKDLRQMFVQLSVLCSLSRVHPLETQVEDRICMQLVCRTVLPQDSCPFSAVSSAPSTASQESRHTSTIPRTKMNEANVWAATYQHTTSVKICRLKVDNMVTMVDLPPTSTKTVALN